MVRGARGGLIACTGGRAQSVVVGGEMCFLLTVPAHCGTGAWARAGQHGGWTQDGRDKDTETAVVVAVWTDCDMDSKSAADWDRHTDADADVDTDWTTGTAGKSNRTWDLDAQDSLSDSDWHMDFDSNNDSACKEDRDKWTGDSGGDTDAGEAEVGAPQKFVTMSYTGTGTSGSDSGTQGSSTNNRTNARSVARLLAHKRTVTGPGAVARKAGGGLTERTGGSARVSSLGGVHLTKMCLLLTVPAPHGTGTRDRVGRHKDQSQGMTVGMTATIGVRSVWPD